MVRDCLIGFIANMLLLEHSSSARPDGGAVKALLTSPPTASGAQRAYAPVRRLWPVANAWTAVQHEAPGLRLRGEAIPSEHPRLAPVSVQAQVCNHGWLLRDPGGHLIMPCAPPRQVRHRDGTLGSPYICKVLVRQCLPSQRVPAKMYSARTICFFALKGHNRCAAEDQPQKCYTLPMWSRRSEDYFLIKKSLSSACRRCWPWPTRCSWSSMLARSS